MQANSSTVLTCPHCGTPFRAYASQVQASRRYCTIACAYEARRISPERPYTDRFWVKVARGDGPEGCWLWTGSRNTNGYGSFRLRYDTDAASRVAWILATGDTLTSDDDVLHTCDVRLCVRNDTVGTYEVNGIAYPCRGHLFLANNAANTADREAKGRTPRGEQRPGAKLTPSEVIEMRARYVPGIFGMRRLSAHYGVGMSTVRTIIRREKWTHI